MDASQRSLDALNVLLRAASPRQETEGVATALLNQFGSLASVVESEPGDLTQVKGVTENAALLLSMMPQLARYLHRERMTEHPVLKTCARAGEYVKTLYLGEHYEQFYMLCLDQAGRLTECVRVQSGTVDETPFYLRNILEAATRASAYAIVLSHNHPSGTERPSPADCESTRRAIESMESLGILVLDHLLVADGEVISIRGRGAIPEETFIRQKRNDPLLTGWFGEGK